MLATLLRRVALPLPLRGRWLGARGMVNLKGPTLTRPKSWDSPDYKFKDSRIKRKDKAFAECERAWLRVDAYGQVMGRLAAKVAPLLCGKHKPIYQNQRDVGDYVVIVNASKIVLTGKKREQKRYYRHSGYPGGLKTIRFEAMFAANPVRPLRQAIWGMMPRNRLKMQRMHRLRLFPGSEHDYEEKLKAPDTKAYDVIISTHPYVKPTLVPIDKFGSGPD